METLREGEGGEERGAGVVENERTKFERGAFLEYEEEEGSSHCRYKSSPSISSEFPRLFVSFLKYQYIVLKLTFAYAVLPTNNSSILIIPNFEPQSTRTRYGPLCSFSRSPRGPPPSKLRLLNTLHPLP